MTVHRRYQFIYGTLAWTFVALVALAALDALVLDRFFLVSLVGLLIVTGLTAPFDVTPAWRKRLRWLLVAGLLAFAYLIARVVVTALPSEAF